MILWIILFFMIVAISFVLAMRSMRDYQEIPQKSQEDYGLFLIRQTGNLTTGVLDAILKPATSESFIISIERLFKGSESALTIFGPKKHLVKFSGDLNLLELEDYAARLDSEDLSVWEVGVKEKTKFDPDTLDNIFINLPKLDFEDQFFWQVVSGRDQTQIRAILYSKDSKRRKVLAPLFHDLKPGGLVKIPRPFSPEQMLNFYRLRSLSKDSKCPAIAPAELIRLLKIF